MSVEYFDEQRRQLIAAIAADTNEVANRIGKTALDKRVIRAMIKVCVCGKPRFGNIDDEDRREQVVM